MNEEYTLAVSDTNEEALASKMFVISHLVLPFAGVISRIPTHKSLLNSRAIGIF